MTELGFAAFDADQHYYEAEDAFIRHMEPSMAKRAMQWAEVGGKKRLLVGGKVNRFIPNPTFDPIARPGSLDDYFRGKVSASDMREAFGTLERMADRPEYRDRDARIRSMDEQNVEAAFFYPTLGVGMEAALEHDLPAMLAAFRAFNRYIEEDWGFAYQERIFAAPYISLADPDWAVEELEWALERDVRVVNLRPGSVAGAPGRRSLGDPAHDPFWQRAADAGITIAFHSGDAGYGFFLEHWGLDSEFEAFRYNPLRSMLSPSPIADAMSSMIGEGVFARFPNLRAATIETGSEWVGPLLKRMAKAYKQHSYAFAEDPVETFRTHVWVSPYYEDDLLELKESIGVERMIFGSDWPHAEGLAEPTEFVHDLAGFTPEEIRLIMRENGLTLVKRQVPAAV
jgi:predicted TIM-barrel fold metal-dependent hydrolase